MRKSLLATMALSLSLSIGFAAGGQAHAAAQPIKTYSSPPFTFYKASAGDTLYFIGKRYGVTVNTLIHLNPGINPNKLYVGQVIKLKSTGNGAVKPAAKPATPAKSSFEQQVVNLVNQYRVKNGLTTLKVSAPLAAMAKDKAIDMYTNNYFDHTSPTYGSPFQMMKSYKISYGYAGENIAMGQKTAQEVMNAWMNSSGHRANILNANYTAIGVAYYKGEWVQEFIG
ncbi:LysM peptidoglycan-binding domain-containing protein [Cohnella endophytica]|uniref:LysM peptidoglycan-binding domain-containing protein n=1 Tax=Cohnella endophytica TaxID=2419778 RepID=A0A494YBJ3_9BACL|nr:CAP domain-containing protein [Cohnella endophytica]RKP57322.1 LysM peptidoglycan-binding domain-containing protein [Cohnella endophytica]